LAETSILTDDLLRELMNVGEVDILVGLPTFNDARTIGQVVQAVRTGLLQYFPRQRAVIFNADGGSRDDTQALVRAASISDMQPGSNLRALRTLHSISGRYPGYTDDGSALHSILEVSELLRASACAVISPDSTDITPEWMERLLRPVSRDGFDLATPIYRRHKFDGLLIRNLVYPMTRALFSRKIREPYPPDFAFSGRLGSQLLAQDIWNLDPVRFGPEMYLTVMAITGGFRAAQVFLGERTRTEHAPADLVRALRRTAGVLFWSQEQTFPSWSAATTSEAIPTIGCEHELNLEPLRLNRKRLHQMFLRGVADLKPLLETILSPGTFGDLQRVASLPEEDFRYPDDLWVRTVYEFSASHHQAIISRDHIVQALAPLYRGKAYTFVTENRETTAEEIEKNVESLCLTFEQRKPSLIESWSGGK
jgi:glycosyltransferase involved in cell wall biosynthesis